MAGSTGCFLLEQPQSTPTLTALERNIQICEQIAQDYYRTHLYIGNDVFDCDNMACDLWDMLITRGINAKIVVGNVHHIADSFEDCNHAWVIAEVEPGTWLAIECTGGYLVFDNPLYYQGLAFDNPKDLRDFSNLYRQYTAQNAEARAACSRYNALREQYNNADIITQLALYNAVFEAMQQCQAEMAKLQDIINELEDIAERMGVD